MSEFKILRDGKLIDADLYTWVTWFENVEGRCIAQTYIDDVHISTVCIGLDHGFGGEPLWFETMIFGGEHDEYQERYATLEEAERGHERALALVKEEVS